MKDIEFVVINRSPTYDLLNTNNSLKGYNYWGISIEKLYSELNHIRLIANDGKAVLTIKFL